MKFFHLHIFKRRDVSRFINWFWIDVQVTIQIVIRIIIRAFFVVRFFDVVVEIFIIIQLIHRQIIHVDTIKIFHDNHVVNMKRIIHINDFFDAFKENLSNHVFFFESFAYRKFVDIEFKMLILMSSFEENKISRCSYLSSRLFQNVSKRIVQFKTFISHVQCTNKRKL
jgi:hypothetical protein